MINNLHTLRYRKENSLKVDWFPLCCSYHIWWLWDHSVPGHLLSPCLGDQKEIGVHVIAKISRSQRQIWPNDKVYSVFIISLIYKTLPSPSRIGPDKKLSRLSLRAISRFISKFKLQWALPYARGMACRCLPYRSQCLVPRIRNRKCFAFCALAEVWRQILCFIRHLPLQPWGSRKVNLVSLKRTVDGSMQYCPVSWTFGSSDRLGYKAALPKNVLAFMNNPNGRCFIFPDNHMGPDLLFFL